MILRLWRCSFDGDSSRRIKRGGFYERSVQVTKTRCGGHKLSWFDWCVPREKCFNAFRHLCRRRVQQRPECLEASGSPTSQYRVRIGHFTRPLNIGQPNVSGTAVRGDVQETSLARIRRYSSDRAEHRLRSGRRKLSRGQSATWLGKGSANAPRNDMRDEQQSKAATIRRIRRVHRIGHTIRRVRYRESQYVKPVPASWKRCLICGIGPLGFILLSSIVVTEIFASRIRSPSLRSQGDAIVLDSMTGRRIERADVRGCCHVIWSRVEFQRGGQQIRFVE